MGKLRRRLLGISPQATSFERRGFRGRDPRLRERIEQVGHTFLTGYHAALEDDRIEPLTARLEAVDLPWRGFAYEGAAMSLTILDVLTPWRRHRRLDAFLAGEGDRHTYMVHVGAGWAIARLPFAQEWVLRPTDPVLRWLAYDGYGFHEGYFHWPAAVEAQRVPRRVRGYARRAFDQGLGRSLWFVEGGDVERIPRTIGAFPAARQSDLWSGIGLSSTYAGGVDRAALEHLRAAAGLYLPQLAQGSAFAAEARQRAGNPAPQTELASQVYCALPAAEAAALTQRAKPPEEGAYSDAAPRFEIWRQRIQALLEAEVLAAAPR